MIPRVLIIAGSDSGGGAGIQADLKTVSVLGAHGMTAIAALTAQNTTGVYAVHPVPPEFVARQIELCATDIGCDAVMTGMLFSAPIIEIVAAKLREHSLRPVVVDPVMVAKGGAPLLQPEAVRVLKSHLLPLATVVTPNLHEAAALTGRDVTSLQQMKEAARALRDLGAENVVVKGGHLEDVAADVFFDGQEFMELHAKRISSSDTHGTGCIFASVIAASLAQRKSVRDSVCAAKEFIIEAIHSGLRIGQGHGPADPMWWVSRIRNVHLER